MFETICFMACVISVCCSIACAFHIKSLKKDRDYYIERCLNFVEEKGEILENWDKAIKYCDKLIANNNALIKYNERLTDINADLRLELDNMKEKNND